MNDNSRHLQLPAHLLEKRVGVLDVRENRVRPYRVNDTGIRLLELRHNLPAVTVKDSDSVALVVRCHLGRGDLVA